MSEGIIYVMSTVVDGLVKIGKTGIEKYDERMRVLENNGYRNVSGLKRVFAIKTNDYSEKERLLDDIFSKSKVGNTELFSIDINMVIQLLSAFEGKIIFPTEEEKEEVFTEATEARESNLIPDGEYSLTLKNAQGTMIISGGKIILKAGAKLGPLNEKKQRSWIKDRNSVNQKENITTEDLQCSSPSKAASIVAGYNMNGWKYWKNKNGDNIDVYRNQIELED